MAVIPYGCLYPVIGYWLVMVPYGINAGGLQSKKMASFGARRVRQTAITF